MSTAKAQLLVGGKLYGGWSSVRVSRSIEAMCGSFTLDVFDRWADQRTSWPLRAGDLCELLIGDVPVITGSVDRRALGLGRGASASVSGRDRAAYLVDCSCQVGKWEFHNVDVLAFIRKVCAPYNIEVRLQEGLVSSSIAVPKKLSIEPGDTAAQAIENACRIAGLLPVPDGCGGLVLSRAGAGRCAGSLVEGISILSGDIEHDTARRYATVHVLGSQAKTDESAAGHVQSKGSATDPAIDPRRVTYVRAEGAVDQKQAKIRAQWEVAVRAARGETVTVTVQGWTQSTGALWPLNHLVHVQAPSLELDNDLLIAGLELSLSRDGGTTTTMTLRRPDAFVPMPVLTPVLMSKQWAELKGGV